MKRKQKALQKDGVYTESKVDYINEKSVLWPLLSFSTCSLPPTSNRRNRIYNRELEKYYGKYTQEIKDSFERGTAL